jgi:hypothetical protein
MLDNYKRKNKWTRSIGREERKSMQEVSHSYTYCRELKGREIVR